jgi:hypothetical protein
VLAWLAVAGILILVTLALIRRVHARHFGVYGVTPEG